MKQKGFTLIELLVVIGIIGILAAVILTSLNSSRSKSRDARRVEDMHQIITALELFYSDAGGYPATLDAGSTLACNGTTDLPTVPGDPQAGHTYTYTPTGSSFTTSICGGSLTLYPSYTETFTLESTVSNLTSGTHTATQAGIQ